MPNNNTLCYPIWSMKWLALVLVFFLVGWELIPSENPLIPTPIAIGETFYLMGGRLLHHSMHTLMEMCFSLFWAFLIAFPLSFAMYRYRKWGASLQPLFVLIQSIPMIALAPLMVLWFGWSKMAIVVPTTLMIFFPLTMSLYKGFLQTPKHLLNYFAVNQATEWQIFSKLQLPHSLPFLLSGLRISSSVAAISAVAGEWAGGQEGLGVLILESRRSFDMPLTYAAIATLMAIGLFFYGIMILLEKRVRI